MWAKDQKQKYNLVSYMWEGYEVFNLTKHALQGCQGPARVK